MRSPRPFLSSSPLVLALALGVALPGASSRAEGDAATSASARREIPPNSILMPDGTYRRLDLSPKNKEPSSRASGRSRPRKVGSFSDLIGLPVPRGLLGEPAAVERSAKAKRAGRRAAREAKQAGVVSPSQALADCAVMLRVRFEDKQGAMRDTWASGFLLRNGRYLATNVHVAGKGMFDVLSKDSLRMGDIRAVSRAGTVELIDWSQRTTWRQDVCIIQARNAPLDGIDRYVTFADVEEGGPLFTLGHRHGRPWTFSRGRLLAKLDGRHDGGQRTALRDLAKQLETSFLSSQRYDCLFLCSPSLVGPGDSGAPVVDRFGRLCGMAFARGPEASVVIPMCYVFRALGRGEPSTTVIETND